jgi:hypothetical protein
MACPQRKRNKMTARKQAPAKPVANLADAKKAQAATRQAQAQAKQRHPAGKQAPKPAAKAPARAAAKPATEAEKLTYSATARCGKVNTRQSATPLVAALDVKISGKKQAAWSAGVIVGFYASVEATQKAADAINGGEVEGWSDAVVTSVEQAKAVAS